MNAPMLIPLTALIAGILLGMLGAGLLTAGCCGLIASVIWLLVWRKNRNPLVSYKRNYRHYFWIFLIFASIGIFTTDLNRPYHIDNPEKYIALTGRIVSLRHSTSGDKAELETHSLIDSTGHVEQPSGCMILLRSDDLPCVVDDEILVPSPISEIKDPANWFSKGVASRMNRKGLFYESRINGEDLEVIGHAGTLGGVATNLRERMETFIEHTRLDKSTQNFLITVLLGDKAYLDNDRRELFADAGLSHILALSGMHVAIIASILMWILFPINFAGLYKWRLVITTILLFGYAFITGMSPSIIRATLMTASVLAALLLERKNSAWNSLLLALFIILVFSPCSLLDVGLQLSFLCVASLIFFVTPLNPMDQRTHPRLYASSAFLLTSIAATAGTWCVSAWYFGKLPLMFLPANILTLPLLPVYLVLAIIYLVFTAVGFEPLWIGNVLDQSLDFLQKVLYSLTGGGTGSLDFRPTLLSVIIWLVLIAMFAMLLHGKRTKPMRISCVVLLLIFIGTVKMDADQVDTGFIMQSNYRDINILTRDGYEEQLLTLPRSSVSQLEIAGRKIVCVDCNLPDTMHKAGIEPYQCDYLVLGSGNREGLETVLRKYNPDTVILHPSVRRQKEEEIISAADSLHQPIYSIRKDGALVITTGRLSR